MAGPSVIYKYSLLLTKQGSNNINQGQSIESWFAGSPPANMSPRQIADALGTRRAALLGGGASVAMVRIATFNETTLGNGFGNLQRLTQGNFNPSAGQNWGASNWPLVNNAEAWSNVRNVGTVVDRVWVDQNNNTKTIRGSFWGAPEILGRDELVQEACNQNYISAFNTFSQRLSEYEALLKQLGVFDRAILPINPYAVLNFGPANPAANPPLGPWLLVGGNDASTYFVPQARFRVRSRNRKGKTTVAPDRTLRGYHTVIDAQTAQRGVQVYYSCGLKSDQDLCQAYSLQPIVYQHKTLRSLLPQGFGRPRKSSLRRRF